MLRGAPVSAAGSRGTVTAVAELGQQSELEKVEAWRMEELVRGGYPYEIAAQLARNPLVDLHEALGLLERGCPPDVARRILA